jgi:non-specific serine/threonine protein kinase
MDTLNAPANLTPQLTPRGHLLALPQDDAPLLDEAVRQRLEQAFAPGAGRGLLHLGTTEIGRILPPA